MKKLVMLLAVLAGCGPVRIGGGPGAATVPPLQAGQQVPLWQHFCAQVGQNDVQGLAGVLDTASVEGWELVSAQLENNPIWFVCFKRPAPNQAPPSQPTPEGLQPPADLRPPLPAPPG